MRLVPFRLLPISSATLTHLAILVEMASCLRQCVAASMISSLQQPDRHHVGVHSCASPPSQVFCLNNSSTASRLPFDDHLQISKPSGRRSLSMAASAQRSTEIVVKESEKSFEMPSGTTPLEMTYLEGNSWLWTLNGVNILVDPVLVGNLDFGIPYLYEGAKKSKLMKEFTLDDLPKLDCILITQGYDDHCHKSTLTAMVEKFGEVRIIASPNAERILGKIGYKHVTYLEPRSTTMMGDIRIRASAGPVMGPPWQRPENGYFVEVPDPEFVIYYEPHCVFKKALLDKERADVIVTPVIKQILAGVTVISGQEDAVQLAKLLQPKYLVTMPNTDLDFRGALSLIMHEKGTADAFKEMLAREVPNCQVLEPKPGVPLEVPVLQIDKISKS